MGHISEKAYLGSRRSKFSVMRMTGTHTRLISRPRVSQEKQEVGMRIPTRLKNFARIRLTEIRLTTPEFFVVRSCKQVYRRGYMGARRGARLRSRDPGRTIQPVNGQERLAVPLSSSPLIPLNIAPQIGSLSPLHKKVIHHGHYFFHHPSLHHHVRQWQQPRSHLVPSLRQSALARLLERALCK